MHRIRLVGLISFLAFTAIASAETIDSTAAWKPSPGGAAIRSLLFPGWGQAYNRRPFKAVIVGTVEQGLIFGIVREHQLFRDSRKFADETGASLYKEQRNRLVWLLAGWLIYASVDAYVDAHLYDFDVSDRLAVKRNGFGDMIFSVGWLTP